MAAKVGKVVWIGRALSGLATFGFLMSATVKMMSGADVMKGMAHLGLSESMIQPLAFLELSCVALYLIPRTSVLGAVLLTGYMGGAICAHMRVGDPFYTQFALGVVVWLGLWLRDARLRALLPFKRPAS